MKKITDEQEWAATYPLFGFLIGRTIGGSHVRHLRLFEGDLEALYVFYRLGELNAASHHQPANIQRLIDGTMPMQEYMAIRLDPVSALSLAEIMRKPRETVRRKLKKLVALGLAQEVEIDGRKGYVITQKAIEHFYHDNRLLYNDLIYLVETLRRFQESYAQRRDSATDSSQD